MVQLVLRSSNWKM